MKHNIHKLIIFNVGKLTIIQCSLVLVLKEIIDLVDKDVTINLLYITRANSFLQE